MTGPDPRAVSAKVEALMAAHVVPGVAVGVADPSGEHTWSFGITNVDHPLPVDDRTVFEIASITKTMTATVAAMLAARQQLDLDAPVRRYLPEFRVRDAGVSEHVTVRDLFTHTAGWFGEYLPPTGHGADAIARAVAAMADLEQVSPAGTFSYNNVSLTVAGRVIEVASGLPYERAVHELLFAPLGMTGSAFRAEDVLYDRLAAGHTVRDGRATLVRSRLGEGSGGGPAGGVRSTVRDLLRYARFHLGDGTVDGTRLMPAAALQAMRAPRVSLGPLGHVGLSWFVEDRGATTIAYHGGATVAHMSQLTLVPDRGAALVILTNGANGARLNGELGEWLLTGWLGLPARVPPQALARQPELDAYAGAYWAPLSDISITPEDGALVMRLAWKGSVAERPTPPPVRLVFTGPDTVAATAGDPAPIGDFIRGADGAVAYFRWGSRARRKAG
ncbi:MAG: serine hydrolase domain-containing protein [Chloroflexota bacterium]